MQRPHGGGRVMADQLQLLDFAKKPTAGVRLRFNCTHLTHRPRRKFRVVH